MKIIREGKLPPGAATAWWVGRLAECRVCGCQVALEEGDDKPGEAPPMPAAITPHANRYPGGSQWVEGPCPTPHCTGRLMLENVFASQLSGAAAARDYNPAPAKQ